MAGFAAGFYGTVANNISDKRDFIRNRVEEDRLYLREQGLQRRAAVQEQRGAYERVARSLIRSGADERTVLGTLEMDPEGLMEVYERTNGQDIGPAALNSMMSISEDYQGSASMSEILDRILPTAIEMPNDTDPLTAKKNTIAAWLGLDTETELNEQVYGADVLPGMTGDQIIASMNIPVAARGTNTDGVTYDLTTVSPLSATEANQLITTANTDYGANWQANRIAELERAATEGGDLEAIQAEKQFLESLPRSGPGRLQAILNSPYGYEVGPTTATLAREYGDRLFGVRQGFNADFLPSILGTPEEAIERAEGDVDNPEDTQTPPPPAAEVVVPEEFETEGAIPDVILASEEEANAVITKHFEDTGDTSAVVQLPDGTQKVVNRIFEDTRGEVLIGGQPVGDFLDSEAAQRNNDEMNLRETATSRSLVNSPESTGLSGNVRPKARPEGLDVKSEAIEMATNIDPRIAGMINDIGLSNPRILRRGVDRVIRTLRQRNQTPEVLALIEKLTSLKDE